MKFLVAALMLMTSVVFAQTRIISIDAFDLSYTGGLALKHSNAQGTDRDQSNFRINLNFAQNIEKYVGLMWKAKVHIERENTDWGSRDTLESAYGAGGGLLYNFQADDIQNSSMVSVTAGLERAAYEFSGADDKSGFNVFAEIEGGKRWDLGHYSVANISYAPTLSLNIKRYGGDIRDEYFKNGYEFRINFLKFDVLF